jgi:hypothetical protein
VGWSIGFDTHWNRDIGYGVPATCDKPKCGAEIDRGLAHVCGGEPYGGERGCGLYFCGHHLLGALCSRCRKYRTPYVPTVDCPEWLNHKATDPSWEEWRKEQKELGPCRGK